MPLFENYPQEARQIETEIIRHGIALGIDWGREEAVRTLAREALNCHLAPNAPDCRPHDRKALARIELFGLAQLMLSVMRQSAEDDVLTHGGPVWKAFARALWAEAGALDPHGSAPAGRSAPAGGRAFPG